MSENINVFFGLELKDGFSPTVQKAQAGLDDLKGAFKSAMHEFADESKKATDKIKQDQESIVKNQNTMFKKMSSGVGGMMARTFAPLALFYAGKKALFDLAGFDKYIQKVGIIGHLSKQQMSQLKSDIKGISLDMGADAKELAQAGMKFASARVPIEQMKEYLEYAVKVQRASSEDLALPDIANFMSVLKSNFPTAQANEMADTMAWMLDKVPNINFLELSNSLAKSAPLAKMLNIGFKELLAIEANSIVNKGGAVASTEMRNVLQTLDKMRNEMMKKIKVGNIEFKQEGDLTKFLDEVVKKYKDIPRDERAKALDKEFGAGTGVILGQYLDQFSEADKLLKKLKYDSQGFVNEISARVDSTPYDKLNKTLSAINLIFLEIGETLDKFYVPDAFLKILQFGAKMAAMPRMVADSFVDTKAALTGDREHFLEKYASSVEEKKLITPIQTNQENKVKIDSTNTIIVENNSNANVRAGKSENESNGANIEVAKVNYLNK